MVHDDGEKKRSLSDVITISLMVFANLLVITALKSTSSEFYNRDPATKKIMVDNMLSMQYTCSTPICILLSRLPFLDHLFPRKLGLTFQSVWRFKWPAIFFCGVLITKEYILQAVGVSKAECITSLVIPSAALMSYVTLGNIPTIAGFVASGLALASAVMGLSSEGLLIWFFAISSSIGNACRTVFVKKADANGPKMSSGGQMAAANVTSCIIFWLNILVKNRLQGLVIWRCLFNGVEVGGMTVPVMKMPVVMIILLSFVTNILTQVMMEQMSPVAYHIQGQVKSILLTFYDLLGGLWAMLPSWVLSIMPAGHPEKLKRDDKISMALKTVGCVVYTSERVLAAKSKKTTPLPIQSMSSNKGSVSKRSDQSEEKVLPYKT